MVTISMYRQRAAILRAKADSARDATVRSAYAEAARTWDLLADAAERDGREVMLRGLRRPPGAEPTTDEGPPSE